MVSYGGGKVVNVLSLFFNNTNWAPIILLASDFFVLGLVKMKIIEKEARVGPDVAMLI